MASEHISALVTIGYTLVLRISKDCNQEGSPGISRANEEGDAGHPETPQHRQDTAMNPATV